MDCGSGAEKEQVSLAAPGAEELVGFRDEFGVLGAKERVVLQGELGVLDAAVVLDGFLVQGAQLTRAVKDRREIAISWMTVALAP